LREDDVAGVVSNVGANPDGTSILRVLPEFELSLGLEPRSRNFVNGPLVNLTCAGLQVNYDPTNTAFEYGVLLPTEQTPPRIVSLYYFGGFGQNHQAYHHVDGTAARYCSVVNGNFAQAAEVDVPAGFTLHRLGPAKLQSSYPRVEQTIDDRSGGLRFAHYETVLRVPLLPVGPQRSDSVVELYQDGEQVATFWVDGQLIGAAPFEELGVQPGRYQGDIQSWADGICTQPLGSGPENGIHTLPPTAVDLCAARGAGIEVCANNAAEELYYS
jgi:hypothetical protein